MIQLLAISSSILIIIEMLLIVICIKWLYSIRLACTNIWLMSQDFSNSFITAKEEVILLHKELKEITTLTNPSCQLIYKSRARFYEHLKLICNIKTLNKNYIF
ncbi:hypothetical protein [Candidatus Tisiphia endosymbiont of Dascillus cervinus]|uniref:hypothetical protein n=1 Tax=Candidatus Tisiphia endosymbiont of Dascillus cervinus TaxID=3066253 RepID=UPI00312C6FDB